jgi:hypothetical protein
LISPSASDSENIRKIEEICSQELQALARYVAAHIKPVDTEQHVRAMAEKLGYKRITENISQNLENAIQSISSHPSVDNLSLNEKQGAGN